MLSASFPFVCRIASFLPFIIDGDFIQPSTSPDECLCYFSWKRKKKKNTGKHPTPKRPGVAVVTVAVGERFETVFFPRFLTLDGWMGHYSLAHGITQFILLWRMG